MRRVSMSMANSFCLWSFLKAISADLWVETWVDREILNNCYFSYLSGIKQSFFIVAETGDEPVTLGYEPNGLPPTTIPQCYFFSILVIRKPLYLTVCPILVGAFIGFLMGFFFFNPLNKPPRGLLGLNDLFLGPFPSKSGMIFFLCFVEYQIYDLCHVVFLKKVDRKAPPN